MDIQRTSMRSPVRRPLALGLASALGTLLSIAQSTQAATHGPPIADPIGAASELLPYVHLRAHSPRTTAAKSGSVISPNSHVVDTCADDGSPNSLRMLAGSVPTGDTVDLTQLPMMCSKITLDHARGPIVITQDARTIQGPGADQLSIDGDGFSSVFRHYGNGMLRFNDVTIAHGYFQSGGPPDPAPSGGCVFSSGAVMLVSSVVTDCDVDSTGAAVALGGAIAVQSGLDLYFSRIANSLAYGRMSKAAGGGAYVIGNLTSAYSTLAGNMAYSYVGAGAYAGGAWISSNYANIRGSTISGNQTSVAGGGVVFFGASYSSGASIVNSTISSNTAAIGGGIASQIDLTMTNSSVVLNGMSVSPGGSGIIGLGGVSVKLVSTIVASNLGAGNSRDIDGAAVVTQDSSHNLITSTTLSVPPDTLSDCPKLQPLADNGGYTFTHRLGHDSPAIDHGIADPSLTDDQRGANRTVGVATDIGAVERQPGEIDERLLVSGFDGLCDQ
jgi:hypothetical protein